MPDGNVQTHQLAGKAAPGTGAVHDHVEVPAGAVGSLQGHSGVTLPNDLGDLGADLDGAAVGLHLLDEGVGDHGAVKIAVVLGVAGAQDIVGVDVGQDLLDAGLVGDVLAGITSGPCQSDTGLDTLFLLLVGSHHQSAGLIEAGGTLLLLLHFQVGLKAVQADVPIAVIQGVVEEAYGARGLGGGTAADASLFKEDDLSLSGIKTQVVAQRRTGNAAADDANLFLCHDALSLKFL